MSDKPTQEVIEKQDPLAEFKAKLPQLIINPKERSAAEMLPFIDYPADWPPMLGGEAPIAKEDEK